MQKWVRLVLVACIVVLFGCDLTGIEEEPKIGRLIINIPTIAPWIVTEKDGPPEEGIADKALMRASSVKVNIYSTARGEYVHSETETLAPPQTLTVQLTPIFLDVEAGYNVYIYIYNDLAPSPSSATCDGSATGVDIALDTDTALTITCFPVSPTYVSEDVFSSEFTLNAGGEKWFRVYPTYARTTDFTFESTSGDMDFYIFGPDGLFIESVVTAATTETINLATSIDSSYYIAMYGFTSGSGRVKYGPGPGGGTLTITAQ